MSAKLIITRKEHAPLPNRATVINETAAQEVDMKLTMAFSGLYDDPLAIDDSLDVISPPIGSAPEPCEKEIRYILDGGSSRSFMFHPSFTRTYFYLKQCSPELAVEYIEALMNYGSYGYEVPDNPVLRAVMDGIVETIEKAYTKYVLRRHKVQYDAFKKAQQEKNGERSVITHE